MWTNTNWFTISYVCCYPDQSPKIGHLLPFCSNALIPDVPCDQAGCDRCFVHGNQTGCCHEQCLGGCYGPLPTQCEVSLTYGEATMDNLLFWCHRELLLLVNQAESLFIGYSFSRITIWFANQSAIDVAVHSFIPSVSQSPRQQNIQSVESNCLRLGIYPIEQWWFSWH